MNDWQSNGMIKIADEVVAIISSIATKATDGIASMSGGLAEGIVKRVSGKHIQRGVYIRIEADEATIDLRVNVYYGKKIDQICHHVQTNVKETVESMTGIIVKHVNICVDGIVLTQEETEKVPVIPAYVV